MMGKKNEKRSRYGLCGRWERNIDRRGLAAKSSGKKKNKGDGGTHHTLKPDTGDRAITARCRLIRNSSRTGYKRAGEGGESENPK